ncbi:MAG: amidohydrolase family protein [Saprospiraceae bacterium]|nr:amidohydrolase family protein [Saprospiraceae bacterium]
MVNISHNAGFRVSTHVSNTADFHNAIIAGVDEIAHLPIDTLPIAMKDVKKAARRKIVVITTCSLAETAPPSIVPKSLLSPVLNTYKENIKRLHKAGVPLAIGSDNPMDSSLDELLYLQKMGVLDNLNLLKIWTETTPKTIFPKRKIGVLNSGYEASFLALEGNPIEDINNIRKIKLRFKQGNVLRF